MSDWIKGGPRMDRQKQENRPRPAWPKQDPLEALGHALNHEQHDPLDAMGRAWAAERRRTGQK
mgnify:CR=1 FL=1